MNIDIDIDGLVYLILRPSIKKFYIEYNDLKHTHYILTEKITNSFYYKGTVISPQHVLALQSSYEFVPHSQYPMEASFLKKHPEKLEVIYQLFTNLNKDYPYLKQYFSKLVIQKNYQKIRDSIPEQIIDLLRSEPEELSPNVKPATKESIVKLTKLNNLSNNAVDRINKHTLLGVIYETGYY